MSTEKQVYELNEAERKLIERFDQLRRRLQSDFEKVQASENAALTLISMQQDLKGTYNLDPSRTKLVPVEETIEKMTAHETPKKPRARKAKNNTS